MDPSRPSKDWYSTKACGHSFEGHEAGGEIDHGLKALIGLVVARGDAAELLQGAEEVLDEMPPAIHRKATRIHQGHDFGGQAATRASDGLTTSPPLAPVPCWWTRMIVPSISAYSKSG